MPNLIRCLHPNLLCLFHSVMATDLDPLQDHHSYHQTTTKLKVEHHHHHEPDHLLPPDEVVLLDHLPSPKVSLVISDIGLLHPTTRHHLGTKVGIDPLIGTHQVLELVDHHHHPHSSRLQGHRFHLEPRPFPLLRANHRV